MTVQDYLLHATALAAQVKYLLMRSPDHKEREGVLANAGITGVLQPLVEWLDVSKDLLAQSQQLLARTLPALYEAHIALIGIHGVDQYAIHDPLPETPVMESLSALESLAYDVRNAAVALQSKVGRL